MVTVGGLAMVLSIIAYWNLTGATLEVYWQLLGEMPAYFNKIWPLLVNQLGSILLHNNARPQVTRMKLQKIIDLGYGPLLLPSYSSYDYQFF